MEEMEESYIVTGWFGHDQRFIDVVAVIFVVSSRFRVKLWIIVSASVPEPCTTATYINE